MNLFDETMRYIYKVLSLKIIFSDPQKFGYGNINYYKASETKKIVVNDAINNLSLWAKAQGTSYFELRNLNQWIRGKKLPKGYYEIEIPKDATPTTLDMSKYEWVEKKQSPKKRSRECIC